MTFKRIKGGKWPMLYVNQPSAPVNMQEIFVFRSENNSRYVEMPIENKELKNKEEKTNIEEANLIEIPVVEPHVIELVEEVVAEQNALVEQQENELEIQEKTEVVAQEQQSESESVFVEKEVLEEETKEPVAENQEKREKHTKPVKKPFSKNKTFKEMNIEERILFLIHRPHYIPKIKCQIKTVSDKFTGYVVGYENGIVRIKMLGKARDTAFSLEEIVYIRMGGL